MHTSIPGMTQPAADSWPVTLLMRRGFSATDADDVAERLHLRDVEGDDRRSCIECGRLAGAWPDRVRCGAGLAVVRPPVLLRCASFQPDTREHV